MSVTANRWSKLTARISPAEAGAPVADGVIGLRFNRLKTFIGQGKPAQ